jgi:hypothetical protein
LNRLVPGYWSSWWSKEEPIQRDVSNPDNTSHDINDVDAVDTTTQRQLDRLTTRKLMGHSNLESGNLILATTSSTAPSTDLFLVMSSLSAAWTNLCVKQGYRYRTAAVS